VKRLPNDSDYRINLVEQEKMILNQPNTMGSNHVVKYRFLDKSDWLFLITDSCEETLEDYVKSSSFDYGSQIAQNIIQQVLTGLADIHRDPKRILHRDLKPSNILRDVDGKWMLADFGIS
jgi:serine/threonine protein kinase